MNRVVKGILSAFLLFSAVFITACAAKSEVTQTGEVTESELHETDDKIQKMYGTYYEVAIWDVTGEIIYKDDGMVY